MKIIEDIQQMQNISISLSKEGKKIGFVPTMGYLHDGHVSLIKRARQENDIVVVSIFVNPIQFGKNEDFDKYPRDLERDSKICKENGVDYIFYPSYTQMYPEGYRTYVEVEGLSDILCGAFRPGHFRGVTTVVLKLFNIVRPDNAYFGKKDYQQFKIIQQMVKDLNLTVNVVGCPTVREPDGLAMSSRNKYLSDKERESAVYISKALFEMKKKFEEGITDTDGLIKIGKAVLKQAPLPYQIQYLEIVDPQTLEPKKIAQKGDIIMTAGYIGQTRLIDNIEI